MEASFVIAIKKKASNETKPIQHTVNTSERSLSKGGLSEPMAVASKSSVHTKLRLLVGFFILPPLPHLPII
jgi:hypothetical protein